jgi:hypothetical protein
MPEKKVESDCRLGAGATTVLQWLFTTLTLTRLRVLFLLQLRRLDSRVALVTGERLTSATTTTSTSVTPKRYSHLGGKNVFDKEAPRVYDAANFSYDPKHHDPRGRMFFARVKFAL